MSVDMLGIPADAPHPQNALRFIDYLLRPAGNRRDQRRRLLPEPEFARHRAGQARRSATTRQSIPGADVRSRFFVDLPASAEYERARTRAWTRLKSGE